ncbi:MAG: NUDIX domain-containing protein [Gemmatimonadota bacterium]
MEASPQPQNLPGAVVRVGVAVIVQRSGMVLLGKRRSHSHGDGTWQLPGGGLELFESVDACARREVAEETGLDVTVIARGPYTSDVFLDAPAGPLHYVTLFVLAEAGAGTAVALEPGKCDGWEWFEWNALPAPLFLPLQGLVASGYRPPV